MRYDDLLILDVSSEYGHFRKFNTTSSPLTYSIPTRPAISGLLGAILGVEREMSAGKFKEGTLPVSVLFDKENVEIGVQLINPVKKTNIAFNLLDTEKSASSFFNIKQRTQIEYELLKNPCFRLFIKMKDKTLFKELEERVRSNRTHFTPYLGLSQFTASISFRAVVRANQLVSFHFQDVITAINLSKADPIEPLNLNSGINFKYTSDTMPVHMLPDRTIIEYAEVVIETTGQVIGVKSEHIWATEEYGNVMFL